MYFFTGQGQHRFELFAKVNEKEIRDDWPWVALRVENGISWKVGSPALSAARCVTWLGICIVIGYLRNKNDVRDADAPETLRAAAILCSGRNKIA